MKEDYNECKTEQCGGFAKPPFEYCYRCSMKKKKDLGQTFTSCIVCNASIFNIINDCCSKECARFKYLGECLKLTH